MQQIILEGILPTASALRHVHIAISIVDEGVIYKPDIQRYAARPPRKAIHRHPVIEVAAVDAHVTSIGFKHERSRQKTA